MMSLQVYILQSTPPVLPPILNSHLIIKELKISKEVNIKTSDVTKNTYKSHTNKRVIIG